MTNSSEPTAEMCIDSSKINANFGIRTNSASHASLLPVPGYITVSAHRAPAALMKSQADMGDVDNALTYCTSRSPHQLFTGPL